MALESEDLLALSQLLDIKLQPIKDDIRFLKLQNENDILPRLRNLESCCTSTYERYKSGVTQIETMQSDIDIMKKVIIAHSERFQQMA